jgi:hypothetical protein
MRALDFPGNIYGTNLFDVGEIDEALGKIEEHVAAWNAIAEHLKAVRAKAAGLQEPTPAESAAA